MRQSRRETIGTHWLFGISPKDRSPSSVYLIVIPLKIVIWNGMRAGMLAKYLHHARCGYMQDIHGGTAKIGPICIWNMNAWVVEKGSTNAIQRHRSQIAQRHTHVIHAFYNLSIRTATANTVWRKSITTCCQIVTAQRHRQSGYSEGRNWVSIEAWDPFAPYVSSGAALYCHSKFPRLGQQVCMMLKLTPMSDPIQITSHRKAQIVYGSCIRPLASMDRNSETTMLTDSAKGGLEQMKRVFLLIAGNVKPSHSTSGTRTRLKHQFFCRHGLAAGVFIVCILIVLLRVLHSQSCHISHMIRSQMSDSGNNDRSTQQFRLRNAFLHCFKNFIAR